MLKVRKFTLKRQAKYDYPKDVQRRKTLWWTAQTHINLHIDVVWSDYDICSQNFNVQISSVASTDNMDPLEIQNNTRAQLFKASLA